jgi:protein-tyrosine phosphatase
VCRLSSGRIDRNLDWDGCFNARDLGGLRTSDGAETRRRSLVRSDTLDHLTADGWAALERYGIRTIVDLRNDEERAAESVSPPATVAAVHVPLDDVEDRELWEHIWANELDGTPLYYGLFLERKPDKIAAALRAIAGAGPGGVVFHCGGGRDRTGLVALVLLDLADVTPEEIVADYELSNVRLPPFWTARGWEDQRPEIEAILARRQTSARELILDLLDGFDTRTYLRRAGLTDDELAALRARLR